MKGKISKMDDLEINKRLNDFSNYLDNMPSSLDKGKLSKFFTAYTECYNKLISYQRICDKKDVYKWKI